MISVNLESARAFFLFCTRSCGCIEHPAFPAPSFFWVREKFWQNLGRVARRDRGGVSADGGCCTVPRMLRSALAVRC